MTNSDAQSLKTIWFAFKVKRGSEQKMTDYLGEQPKVLEVKLFLEQPQGKDDKQTDSKLL